MYTFENGQEMLNVIKSGTDLYNPKTETYVFLYNGSGSICYYDWIDHEYAVKLSDSDEYWGASLGPGGNIADDPSYENFNAEYGSNLDWCNDNFVGNWYDTATYLEEIATNN